MLQNDGFTVLGPSTDAIAGLFGGVIPFGIDKTHRCGFGQIDSSAGIEIVNPYVCILPIGKVFAVR